MVIRKRRVKTQQEVMEIYKYLSQNYQTKRIIATTRSGKRIYQDVVDSSQTAHNVYSFINENWRRKNLRVTITAKDI